jgi:hypothetical protein
MAIVATLVEMVSELEAALHKPCKAPPPAPVEGKP